MSPSGCVFQLTDEGLELIEVAPGIDIERDILPHMGFTPIIKHPAQMDARLFRDEPMELLSDLLNLNLPERVSYDAERNILFLNLEGWHARIKSDIDDLRKVLVDACKKPANGSTRWVNHDGFRINENLYDDYASMIQYLSANYYLTTTRYATSAFLRLKMEEALNNRGLAPHVFERKGRRHAFLDGMDRKVRRASTAIDAAA